MTDSEREIERLLADIRAHDAVDDAFLAKSFTDRLLILDVDDGVPDRLRTRLRRHDFHDAETVYGESGGDASALGDIGDGTRHHFVDTRTRGSHQSYVVE